MIRRAIGATAAGLVLLAAGLALAEHAYVAGTATYRERIMLPRDAVLEVVLQDVSRADSPAIELGRVEATGPGNPPYSFQIPYDREAIDDRHVYAVRAAIKVEGRPVFVSDVFHPVLTHGAPSEVEIVLVRTGANGGAAPDLGAPRSLEAVPGQGAAAAAARSVDVIVVTGDPAQAAPGQLRGFVTFMAEAATFTDCATGRAHRIEEDGDYAALEHAYVAGGREPGGPVMASFEGEIEETPANGGAPAESVVHVTRFVGIWPGEECGPDVADRPLLDTQWQFVQLGETDLDPAAGRAPPHLMLQSGTPLRFSATVGCNTFAGGIEVEGERLRFGQAAATLMACPEPLDAHERALGALLDATVAWRISGDRLELLDAQGMAIAELAAVERE